MPDLIQATGLVKRYGRVTALAGLDLAVSEGTVLGVLGPNGAGKTTAVSILATLIAPDAGSARVAGADVVRTPRDVRRKIGLSGQFAAVDEHLTGFENLDMIGRLYHLGRRRARSRATELLEQFDLVAAGGRPVKTYSGGMRRRLDLAGALVADPPVLFLDEPTTGLDPHSRRQLWEVIRRMVGSGTTVLLTTQYMEEADQLADRVLVIDHGKAIAEGTPDELKRLVGAERIEVTVAAGAAVSHAREVLDRFAVGEQQVDERTRTVVTPIAGGGAEALMQALRALDQGQVAVQDVGLRRPTLDDVFLTLTGHAAEPTEAGGGRQVSAMLHAVSDAAVIAKRNVIKIKRVPEVLVFVLLSPIMFVLLFAYVFGDSIAIPGGSYREFLIAGIFAQTVVFGSIFTGAGLAEDIQKGIMNRFRSLPMSRSALLVGRTMSDVLYNAASLAIMALTGLLVGWRIDTGVLPAIAGFSLLLLFAYAFSWIMAFVGLMVPSVEVINNATFMVTMPLTFVANTFVPAENLPPVLRTFALWNPVSAVTQATRELFGNIPPGTPDPVTWPLAVQHPVLYTVIWAAAIIAVFAPLAVRRYRTIQRA